MSLADAILAGLNPEQREAVQRTEGPLLVLAGAGSGKTRMLTHRIAHLLATGAAEPWQILAVTFTNKAAREMRERVDRLLGEQALGIRMATFHSACVRILRRDIGHMGYGQGFAIYDQSDSLAAVKRVLRALHLDERSHPPRAIRAEIDRLKNRGLLPADLSEFDTLNAESMSDIYQRYQRALRQANALDFGDLLLLTVKLFENHPAVLQHYQRRWRYVLVDEYQDTNPVQYRLLRLLCDEHRNLCVVGDEDQSIYRFREADIRNILDFEKDFPGARVARLERNYRSTQAILDAASAVVANNVERKGKRLYTEQAGGEPVRFFQASDEREEASWVVNEALSLIDGGAAPGEVAVFYRTHAQSRPFEEELLKYNVPYVVVGGTRFYDRAEIKDALAYLRVLRNPNDTESLVRIINKPGRGIGRTSVERILELAAERELGACQAIPLALSENLIRGTAKRRLPEFLALLDRLRAAAADPSLPQLLSHVLEQSGYLRALEREGTIEAEARLENLKELVSAAEEFDRQNREAETEAEPDAERDLVDLFLEQVTLMSEADQLDEHTERVPLMTCHVAKGLEFSNVFLVGLEEGLFPHVASLGDRSAIEEERRLCYVGMTRAKERLYLTHATLRRMHGSARYNSPSRFLDEVPEELGVGRISRPAPQMDLPPRPQASTPVAPPTPRSGPVVDYSDGQWSPGELPPLAEGQRVEHPIFGAGTIQQVIGSGAKGKIRVHFDRAGIKTIVTRFAQLRLIS